MAMSVEKLTLSHQAEFSALISKMNAKSSEYSFANLYLFRNAHNYTVERIEGNVFLRGHTYDNLEYLMPFTPLKELGCDFVSKLLTTGTALFPVDDTYLECFDPEKYSLMFELNDSDYIYTREKIATFPGRHLHKKRNLVKQYRTLYKSEDKPFISAFANDAIYVLDEWFKNSGAPLEDTDYIPCIEAINHTDDFKLTGLMSYADDMPSGFLLGEELNDSTYVIHFAKGITSFKGIYAYLYQTLANNLPERFTTLNFEQDMGKDSLRQAKSTYLPDAMHNKYRVLLKK